MASYNELNALIDAYINRNGVQAITGQILNGVLKAMVEQLGRGYTIMGAAIPTTDPGTPDGPECYFASETGTYTDFDGLQIVPGELALLCYTPTDGWTKATLYEGFRQVTAQADDNIGVPSVGVSYSNGVLDFRFRNIKGEPGENGQDGLDGDAAGFGTIGADITGGVGTPGVTVESSGPATAKNLQFHFTNLKGETGVTSVVATVDNTTGNPACTVSLVGQQLTFAFSGLKGAQGDTGVSANYPIAIVNNLTTNDATQALSAAMGVELAGQVSQLQQEVGGINKELDVFVEKTNNVFNPSDFSSYPGISMADGVVSGTALAFHTAFGGVKYYPLYTQAFQENTQYTFSCETRTDNEAEATGNGLQLRMVYTDGTVEVKAHSPNTQTDWAVLKGTSTANKTLAGIGLSYSASDGKNNTWYIKEIQLEEGTVSSDYVPPYLAIDFMARDIASGVRYSLDYSVFNVNTSNAGRDISGLDITNGEGGTLYVFPLPDDKGRNNYFIRFYNGATELAMLRMTGFGKISFTNTYGSTIDKIKVSIERVNVKVNNVDVFIVPTGKSNALAEGYYAEDGTKRMERLFQGFRTIFDFSSETIGGTYKGRGFYNISIPVGAAFKIYVTGNDDGANSYYFNFWNGNTRIATTVSPGNGNRVISLTNTYGSEITGLEMTVQAVNYAATYDILVIKDGDKDVAHELDLLKKDISWLPDFLSVPDYYATMLSTKVSSIRNAMLEADKNGSTFIFITDVHWPDNSQKSPALINYLLQRLPVTDVFFGGDVINGGVPETQIGYFEDFWKKMHQAAPRFFSVRGNHENNLNDGGTGFDGDYFYTLLLKYADYLVEPGEYDNYYFDNKTTKTRFIVLNTGQGGDHYTTEQSAWLSTILDGMPSGYHAIILLHMAYATASALQSGTMSPTMAAAASVADSFNAQNNGKKVEAFISGHLHNDANKVTSGGIPIILTDCDARQTSSGNPQTNGTINEQAFDVITIDYSGKITCTRIGRGNDREINY